MPAQPAPDRAMASALLFLTLCVAWGPDRACFVIVIVAIAATWFALCKRWPLVGYFSVVFFGGFLGGLFGYRPRRRR